MRDLDPLKDLTKLQTLNLASTRVTNLDPLKGLTNLQTLNLESLKIVKDKKHNIKPMGRQFQASSPVASVHSIIINLNPLRGLAKLQTLNLAGTKNVTEAQIDALEDALADLRRRSAPAQQLSRPNLRIERPNIMNP